MRRFGARVLVMTLTAAAGVAALRGQTAGSRMSIQNVGLPAVDLGISGDRTHAPSSAVNLRRAAIQAALLRSGAGDAGVRYTPGRVLVRFRDDASSAAKQAAMAAVSSTAVMAARPNSADFDVVRIDPAEDAEAVARAFGDRPEVVYAQAAYRVHTMFKPNDPLYATYQWRS